MRYAISLRFPIILFVLFALASCATSDGIYHTVRKGQTLYQIGQGYQVNDQYLARLNGIDDPSSLRIGQKLFIPGAKTVKNLTSAPSTSSHAPPHHSPSLSARSTAEANTTSAERKKTPAKSTAAASVKSAPTKAVKGIFAWPLRGNLLQAFGPCGNRNYNGVEIAAPEATPVQAAAAGRVTYSGDGIRGFGHLIIIKHDGSFYTVYGFNRKNLVESGAFVSQGQKIALSGIPPSGGKPRLHFEIREGKSPVDPIFYLP